MNISYSELMMMKIEEKRKELVLSVQTEGFLSSNAILKSQELDQLIFEYQQNRLYKH
ncbi:aspartyl-phosphate phosphatase Spo0E family protein [Bacillus andreraoultii]|uniref:aspartyl-phosphate phosphatase Spo0E family protein n=1 Tax=Bacillus andreraoultii TaxID=1499685 RepID=UPI000B11D630|nr:aspartyl-phosphate phosphatase Spo0E family protein [Bacillus andreraoultii]